MGECIAPVWCCFSSWSMLWLPLLWLGGLHDQHRGEGVGRDSHSSGSVLSERPSMSCFASTIQRDGSVCAQPREIRCNCRLAQQPHERHPYFSPRIVFCHAGTRYLSDSAASYCLGFANGIATSIHAAKKVKK